MNECKNIIWMYIDTQKATIKAIEDYPYIKKSELILSDYENNLNDFNSFRKQQTTEFLNWFEPAWLSLSEETQSILKEFYMAGNLKSGAGVRLQFKLNYSERQLHRIKEKAISELSKMLFGK